MRLLHEMVWETEYQYHPFQQFSTHLPCPPSPVQSSTYLHSRQDHFSFSWQFGVQSSNLLWGFNLVPFPRCPYLQLASPADPSNNHKHGQPSSSLNWRVLSSSILYLKTPEMAGPRLTLTCFVEKHPKKNSRIKWPLLLLHLPGRMHSLRQELLPLDTLDPP